MIALGLILYATAVALLLVFFTGCKRADELDLRPYRLPDQPDQPDQPAYFDGFSYPIAGSFEPFVTGARSHDDDVAPPIAGGEG